MDAFPGLVGNVSATVLHREEPEPEPEPTPHNTPPRYVTINEDAIRAKLASSVKPAYLILGATPGEYPNGRTFYDDPHYWLLGLETKRADTFRHFEINWENPKELAYLASRLPGQFDVLCFDFSTAKFFFDEWYYGDIEVVKNDIRAFYTLLKKDGLFIVEMTTLYGGESKRRYYDDIIRSIGFISQGLGYHTDLVGNTVINNIYGSHEFLRDSGKNVILGLYKKPSRGGKRRLTKRSKRVRRKSSRKVPQIVKY